MLRHPLPTALFFGLVPPTLVSLLLAVFFAPMLRSFGPIGDDAVLFVVVGGYLFAAPPLAITGWIVARAARAGEHGGWLLLYAGWTGLVVTLLAALAWGLAGWLEFKFLILAAVALAGALCSASVTALLMAMLRFHFAPQDRHRTTPPNTR